MCFTPAATAASMAALCCGTRFPGSLADTSISESAPSSAAESVDASL